MPTFSSSQRRLASHTSGGMDEMMAMVSQLMSAECNEKCPGTTGAVATLVGGFAETGDIFLAVAGLMPQLCPQKTAIECAIVAPECGAVSAIQNMMPSDMGGGGAVDNVTNNTASSGRRLGMHLAEDGSPRPMSDMLVEMAEGLSCGCECTTLMEHFSATAAATAAGATDTLNITCHYVPELMPCMNSAPSCQNAFAQMLFRGELPKEYLTLQCTMLDNGCRSTLMSQSNAGVMNNCSAAAIEGTLAAYPSKQTCCTALAATVQEVSKDCVSLMSASNDVLNANASNALRVECPAVQSLPSSEDVAAKVATAVTASAVTPVPTTAAPTTPDASVTTETEDTTVLLDAPASHTVPLRCGVGVALITVVLAVVP